MTFSSAISAIRRGIRLSGGRGGLRLLAPALILLAVCVFAWGLRYKLSFYPSPHSATHHVQEAKLLLPDRSNVPAAALRRAAESAATVATSLWIPVLFLFAGLTFWLSREWVLEPERARRAPLWLCCVSGFSRPPPRG